MLEIEDQMQSRRNINLSDDSGDEQPLIQERAPAQRYQSPAINSTVGLLVDSKTIDEQDRETRPLLDEYNVEPSPAAFFLCARVPARYVTAIWAFFGFFCLYAMRVNLSVAIVAMVWR